MGISELVFSKKYNNRKMEENWTDKLNSIFEIKVKEDNLCTAFRTLQLKILTLQRKLEKENQLKQAFLFNWDEDRLKRFIKQTVTIAAKPLQEKTNDHQMILNTMKYNHENLCQNMGEEFKTVTADFDKYQQQVRMKVFQQEAKTQKECEVNKIKMEEIQLRFNQFYNQNHRKERDFQIKIDNVWDVIRDIRKNYDDIDPKYRKKSGRQKNSEQKEPKENLGDTLLPKSRKGKKDESSILKSTMNLDKSVEYAGVLLKVEALEHRVKDITNTFLRGSEKIVNSRQRIQFEQNYENSEFQGELKYTNSSENIRKKKQGNPSRFGRISINSEVSERDEDRIKAEKQKQRVSAQLKKMFDKINELRFKYTHLQQNYDIILAKFPRIAQIQASLIAKMQQVEKMKMDLHTINQIKIRYRKIQASYEDQENKFVLKQNHQKDLAQLKESFRQIQSFIPKYAKQDQVRQAFEFVENKIKDIVVVLTDKFEADREGAINKVHQIKCLTCDKQTDFDIPNKRPHFSAHKSKSSKIMRVNRTTYKRFQTQA